MVYVIRIEQWFLPLLLLIVLLLLTAFAWGVYRFGSRNTRKAQTALNATPVGVAIFDNTGRRVFVNQAAQEMLVLVDTAQLSQAREAVAKGMQQTWIVRGPEGTSLQAHVSPISGNVLLTLRDITQRQEAEASYRRLIYQLSHEMLTPLTAIQGHLAYASSGDIRDDSERIRSLGVVRDEVERLTRLTSNLLLLSRLQSEQPLQLRPTNLTAVAEEAVLQLMEHADARDITLNVHTATQLARPSVDKDAWKQVFLNLIDNGIKYGTDGGTVDVTLQQNGPNMEVDVTDNGPGISPEDRPHIFTEMFRSESQRQISGTGLGLTIVKRIVERHGGQITCSSEPGNGTTFRITLPLRSESVTRS